MAVFVVVSKLPAAAMAIYPFIFIKKDAYKHDQILVHHESIHFKQQLELLIIPFYFCYLINYLINFIKYKSHHIAYLNIVFEKEAYANERDLNYLKTRKTFAWIKWLNA